MPKSLAHPAFELGQLDLSDGAVQSRLDDIRAQKLALNVLNRPLVLVGAGSLLAQEFVSHMISLGHVIALVDNARAGQIYMDVPFIGDSAVSDVLAKAPHAIGVLCCASENAIAHFTRVWGERPHPLISYFEVVTLLPDANAAGRHLGFLPEFSDVAQICALHEKAKGIFADILSRRTLDALMLYRLTWDMTFIAQINKPEKAIYFEPDVMPLGDHEILVDGGAYDGDTARDFVSKTGGRYDHIHSFEIDPQNADWFATKTASIERLSLHRIGLWNEQAEIGIDQRIESSSRVNHQSQLKVPLDAMDNMDLGPVSLIKLDIEGAEVQALNGARKLIQAHKPKLAICTYHRPNDFDTIPATLCDIRDDFTLRLRHYSPILFDSVIYAV